MKTCLVSLISDQTIPNILVAAELRPDYLLLLSTEHMEKKGKSSAILTALSLLGLDYHDNSGILKVTQDSIPDFYEKVTEWLRTNREDFAFTVNLTCGTKLMAIAAYELFKTDANIVYMPIPKNFYFPVHRPNAIVPIKMRLPVEAYLAAYGVPILNRKNLDSSKQDAYEREKTTLFIFDNYKELHSLLRGIGEKLRELEKKDLKNGYDFSFPYVIENQSEKQLMDDLGFTCRDGLISRRIDKSIWNYLRGGWLEERVFLAIETVLPEGADVLMNVNCQACERPNEYDVLFTLDNVLYVVECKSLDNAEEKTNDFLYKIGALKQDFGITPKGILATTSENILDENRAVRPHIVKRGSQFKTTIAPLSEIKDLEAYFKSVLLP